MIIKDHCPVCKKAAKFLHEGRIGTLKFREYECGHKDFIVPLKVSDFEAFTSIDGKRPYDFQKEGAIFGINSGIRCLIEDEMGLGKTVQALMIIYSLRKELARMGLPVSMGKFLVICKSRLAIQWMREIVRWLGHDVLVQIIRSEEQFLLPGVAGYIVSYDLLWRFKDLEKWQKKLDANVIICDEIQNIKNADAKRTRAVQTLAKNSKYLIFLSGTPIKNHAGEFFPTLNMLRPDKFPTRSGYAMRWVDTYYDGRSLKYGGIKYPEEFKNYTKDFIIRRTRKEVMPELPTVTRDFRYSELGAIVEADYIATVKEFQEYYFFGSAKDSQIQKQANILAYLAKMRHLTGLAKIQPTVEEVEEFVMETDRKLVVFVHHEDVAEALVSILKERQRSWPAEWGKDILYLPAGGSQQIIDDFAKPEYRILVTKQLSASEGLNLQFCADCIQMERQWNPANEEQGESRFIRIGQLAESVFAKYMIAVGTVDEFLTDLVEVKRCNLASTLDAKKIKWNEATIIKELAEIIAQRGGKKWGW